MLSVSYSCTHARTHIPRYFCLQLSYLDKPFPNFMDLNFMSCRLDRVSDSDPGGGGAASDGNHTLQSREDNLRRLFFPSNITFACPRFCPPPPSSSTALDTIGWANGSHKFISYFDCDIGLPVSRLSFSMWHTSQTQKPLQLPMSPIYSTKYHYFCTNP
jgi:hypothetical protein